MREEFLIREIKRLQSILDFTSSNNLFLTNYEVVAASQQLDQYIVELQRLRLPSDIRYKWADVYGNFKYQTRRSDNLLLWKVTGELNEEMVKDIVCEIKNIVRNFASNEVKLLVDNTQMMDNAENPLTFNENVLIQWYDLQRWLIPYCSDVTIKCATSMMENQMTELCKESGLIKVTKVITHLNLNTPPYA